MSAASEGEGVHARPLGFHHEALLYSGTNAFLAGTVPLIRETVAAGGAALVAVSEDKIRLLRGELDGEADRVQFV